MTFRDLPVGAKFFFVEKTRRLGWFVKTGERTYERQFRLDDIARGVVGVGDNPVELVTGEAQS
jgi:hypothetical protein